MKNGDEKIRRDWRKISNMIVGIEERKENEGDQKCEKEIVKNVG